MPLLPNAAARPHKPRILLVPAAELPVPAVQGGAVETLVTHLIRENERRGCLDLLCASIPDPGRRRAGQGAAPHPDAVCGPPARRAALLAACIHRALLWHCRAV